jgi:DNA-binding XRE family transcriptional regulator
MALLTAAAGLLQKQVGSQAGLTRTSTPALERGEIATLSDIDAAALTRVRR